MRFRRKRAQGAGHLRDRADSGQCIRAARRAGRNAAVGVQLNVGRQFRIDDIGAGLLAGFQRPFIHCGSNLTHVVDARILLRGGTGFHEVGNSDGGQQSNDGHNDHDFHQGETRFAGLFHLFHFIFLLF